MIKNKADAWVVIGELEQRVRQLNAELEKWRNWKPDDEDLADMQEQALARDGTYTSGLAAGHVYMRGLEARQRELEAENKRRGDAIVHACNCARPYVDESGVVCISLHPYGGLKRIALEIQDALKDD